MANRLPEIEWELLGDVPTTRHRRATDDLLCVDGLCVSYGNRVAIRDVSLRVTSGEVVSLIGHNGSGKSSTLRAIFGLTAPQRGDVVLGGRDVVASAPSAHTRRADGVGFVPTTAPVFADLTVRENLILPMAKRAARARAAERVANVLEIFPSLGARLDVKAGRLSGGEQRMVGLCLALMTEPRLLLLDEPTKELSPRTIVDLLGVIRTLARERGVGILLAEANVAAALHVSHRVYVMRSGRIESEHAAADLLAAGPSTWWRMF